MHAVILKISSIIVIAVAGMALSVYASDLTSTSFIIRDPLVGTGGSFGTSASFQAFGSGDITSIGRATSASFEGRYGFLWFPKVVSGVLSGNLNGQNVDLTWTASTGELGWAVTAYNVGVSSTSGSGYSFTNVGNVLSYTYSNVIPGTYYYIFQTLDAFGNVIAASNEVSIVVPQSLTFTISDATIGFGSLTTGGVRYATGDTLGSGSLASAHTLGFSTNTPGGYVITYIGPTLTSGGNTISTATISGDADGSPGTEQFALSLSTSGNATIPSGYQRSSDNWNFVASTPATIATETGVTETETFSLYYLANTAPQTEAGQYTSTLTFIATPTF